MRSRNLTSHDECRYCDDEGWVVVDSGTPHEKVEEMIALAKKELAGKSPQIQRLILGAIPVRGEGVAPCPFCEQGYANEFPGTDNAGREYSAYKNKEEGYWKGRDTSELQPRPYSRLATREENLAGLKEISRRLVVKDMPGQEEARVAVEIATE